MSKIKQLLQSYRQYISVPWRNDVAADQRVIFCIYIASDERALRIHLDEFGLVTREAQHDWAVFDLTDTFAHWLSKQKYAKSYFQQPNKLSDAVLGRYLQEITAQFASFVDQNKLNEHSVVAVQGVGSLFGLLKVKDVVDHFAPMVQGRLVIFFPGNYENNNYRLLDGYDGWNYHAVPITADKVF